ncbi:MAG: S8 family serine peptidase [Anaerolineae bacterium]|nr:S8 family serine peptidase [Anaerolineae bacterium]
MPSKRSSSSRSRSGGQEKPAVPERIFAQASPRSIGGVSMFEAGEQINSQTVVNFFSEDTIINQAANQLQQAGFEILQITASMINIAGSPETYREAFNTEIYAEERPVIKELGEETTAAFLDSPDTDVPGLISTRGTAFQNLLEGVAIEEPRYFMAALPFPPKKAYWHLEVPADVSLAANADLAHRSGTTGRGVKVAMVDSGWFKHPYFVKRGYRAAPVVLGPAAANPLADESGHGTGESANIFAIAPDAELLPVKINFVNSIGAFNAAVGLNPDIITCSWGSSKQTALTAADQALAAAIAAAVAAGIIVIFSAGNGHFGFPGQHPDVISAGGVYMEPNGNLRASNYASGFMSQIYPNRRVPDVCGLVGLLPRAAYIMLPVEPNDDIDRDLAGGTHPNGDETANNDGWAAFSGTSAAAPQLAGTAALMKQACVKLTPADVKDILRKSARDVTTGNCNPSTGGHPAAVGPDLATGDGLVDAHKAVLMSKVRCLPSIVPPGVIGPTVPPVVVRPPTVTPPSIVPPTIRPPIPPTIQPPIPPIGPQPPGPITPAQEASMQAAQESAQELGLTPEDIQHLEDVIRNAKPGEEPDLGL